MCGTVLGTIMGAMKGDTRSLDYGSHGKGVGVISPS